MIPVFGENHLVCRDAFVLTSRYCCLKLEAPFQAIFGQVDGVFVWACENLMSIGVILMLINDQAFVSFDIGGFAQLSI